MSAGEQFSEKPPTAEGFRCPYCQAKRITAAAVPCWLCQEKLPAYHGPLPSGGRVHGDNPALILLGVLVLLLAFGLMIETPGIAILVAIAVTPALIRAAVVSSRRRQAGEPLSGMESVGAVLSSVGVVALVGLASFAAFFVTCFVVCFAGLAVGSLRSGDTVMAAAIGAGLIPAIALFVLLIRKFWPRKE